MDDEENTSTPTFLDVLLQGDGRNMGSSTSNVQMAFAILNEGRDVARPRSHYTVGIMDMSEDYDSLEYNFGDLLREVNAMEGTQDVPVRRLEVPAHHHRDGSAEPDVLLSVVRVHEG
jgi:hypothetical protein